MVLNRQLLGLGWILLLAAVVAMLLLPSPDRSSRAGPGEGQAAPGPSGWGPGAGFEELDLGSFLSAAQVSGGRGPSGSAATLHPGAPLAPVLVATAVLLGAAGLRRMAPFNRPGPRAPPSA